MESEEMVDEVDVIPVEVVEDMTLTVVENELPVSASIDTCQ